MVSTLLGCGTSVGSPMIGRAGLKQFRNPKNRRLRASLLVEPLGRGGPAILIDTSPDLRSQVLRYFPRKPRLDAVLMTHEHADHLHGLDDIRPFNFFQRAAIPFYGEARVLDVIHTRFAYIFYPVQVGGGLPQLSLNAVGRRSFRLSKAVHPDLRKLQVTPLPLEHGKLSCLGYRIGNLAYITDCSKIPDATLRRLEGLEVLILDCLRYRSHPTHLNVDEALAYAQRINAKRTIFTHMADEIEYEEFRKQLPPRMVPGYDGLRVRLAAPD